MVSDLGRIGEPMLGRLIVVWSLLLGSAQAEPIMEEFAQVRIDWGNLRVVVNSGQYEGSIDKKGMEGARARGFLHLKETLKEMGGRVKGLAHLTPGVLSDEATVEAKLLASGGGSGIWDVYFPSLFSSSKNPVKTGPLQIEAGSFTGLIIRLESTFIPRSEYRIVSPVGEILFDRRQVHPLAFGKNLMGRWFYKPSRKELLRHVGPNPVSLVATINARDEIVIAPSSWGQAFSKSRAALNNGRIIVVLPASTKPSKGSNIK